MGVRYKTVTFIEQLPEQELIDIETTTRTFIANGFVSHNSMAFDEIAHVLSRDGSPQGAQELVGAAIPAMDQVREEAFAYMPSSPWQKLGVAWDTYGDGLRTRKGEPVSPEIMIVQLSSFDVYEDWSDSRATRSRTMNRPPSEYNEIMRSEERRDPAKFRVERRGQWAEVLDQYLYGPSVDRLFKPIPNFQKWPDDWYDRVDLPQDKGGPDPADVRHLELSDGIIKWNYRAHLDPAKSNHRCALVIAHCYDDQTEVLTKRGWLRFVDLKEADHLATLSKDGRLEYQEPSKLIAHPYEGDLYVHEGEAFNFAVTPNHRMLYWDGESLKETSPDTLGRHKKRPRYILKAPVVPYEEGRDGFMVRFERDPLPIFERAHLVDEGLCFCGCGGKAPLAPHNWAAKGRRKGLPQRYIEGHRGRWLPSEDAYLIEHHDAVELRDVATALGRSLHATRHRIHELGLARRYRHRRPTPPPPCRVEDYAAFVGFWLAEGRKAREGFNVEVVQVKEEGVRWVDDLFLRLGWPHRRVEQLRPGRRPKVTWSVKSDVLSDRLMSLVDGGELRLPDETFSEWGVETKRALLDGLLMGDGSFHAEKARFVDYGSTSRRLVDDIQRLLVHLGMGGRVYESTGSTQKGWRRTMWKVTIMKGRSSNGIASRWDDSHARHRLRVERYEGTVYCATVPNGSLVVRRHGQPMVCGNSESFFHFGEDERGREGWRPYDHVIVDGVWAWDPVNYEGHTLPYEEITAEIAQICMRYFTLREFTTDQYGFMLLPLLRMYLRKMKEPPLVREVDTTNVSKLRRWERAKTALSLSWVHSPRDTLWEPLQSLEEDEPDEGRSLLEIELRFLQRKGNAIGPPTIGDVQSDDAADAFSHTVSELLADQIDRYEAHQRLLETPVAVGARGGYRSGSEPVPGSTAAYYPAGRAPEDGKWGRLDQWAQDRMRERGGYGQARETERPRETAWARKKRKQGR
jgi:hypothetical protein